MIIRKDDVMLEQVDTGVERKVMSHCGNLMSVEVHFKKGAVGKVHTHVHEQISYIIKGKFEVEINEIKEIISVGDTFYVNGNVPHGVVALEESIILDTFTPQREDFL
jgi:quercetin dioxygenase-like cupin family protein